MSTSAHQIHVKLTPAGSNILGGIGWATLDLPPDFTLQMSKDVLTLSDVSQFKTESVLPFEVDQTTVNDAALLPFESPLTLDNLTPWVECRAVVDGSSLDFDRIYFVGRVDENKKWALEFRRSVKNWAELASEKKLNTIDLGFIELNAENVQDGWDMPGYVDGESPVRWLPVDYGNWVDLSEPVQFTDPPVKGVFLEDLRPFISPVALLTKGFCEIGITLDGVIFETALLRQQWAYILKRNYYSESRGGTYKVILRKGYTEDFTLGGSNYFAILETAVDYDPGSIARHWQTGDPEYGAGLKNPFEYKARFKFCFSGTFVAPSDGPTTIKFQVEEFTTVQTFNVLVSDAFEFNMTANETKNISFCVDVELEPGQKAFITMSEWRTNPVGNSVLKGGHRFVGQPNMQSFVRSDIIELKNIIHPDYTLLDFFKGIVHELNGYIDFDKVQNVLSVHPFRRTDVYGDVVPGFIREGEIIDGRNKQICDSTRLTPIQPTLKRYSQFSFADTTDAYIDDLDPTDPPFSRKILNGIDLPNEVQEYKNPFFEPTMERQSELLKAWFVSPLGEYTKPPFLPVLWDNTDANRSFNIGPRLLFFPGIIKQKVSEEIGDLNTYFYFEGKDPGDQTANIAWAGHTPTFIIDPTTIPAVNANLVYGSAVTDLFVLFYLGTSVSQKRGMFLDMLMFISANDYAGYDFRTQWLLDYQGRPVRCRLDSITDFRSGQELSTPMRFFVEPMDTECCDLPCSCRFSDCRYYSDFGIYMTQETLDDLQITSFKVDNEEMIDAPVGFGLINIIQLGNGLYVTNLVDTLQSLAIPYFTFSYSPDIYTPKEQPKYFRIKKPICQTFSIIISDGEGQVYRYTEEQQQTKWFSGGSWEPFGYGGGTIEEPEDCQITTEY